MTIKRSFRGAVLQKPGAYSVSEQALTGGSVFTTTGVLFIIGEASQGQPGSASGIREWTSDQLGALINFYGSGPIVDVARAAVNPSRTPNIQGAQKILTWQTNAATKASLALANGAADDLLTISDRLWGAAGNSISVEVLAGSTANQRVIKLTKGLTTETLQENAAIAQLNIEYTGAGTASDLTISVVSGQKQLAVATTGGDPEDSFIIPLTEDLRIQELVDQIAAKANFTCTATVSERLRFASDLDPVVALDILTAQDLFRLQAELEAIINEQSSLASAAIIPDVVGLPAVAGKAFMTGGARGASANSDFTTALSKSLANEYNTVVPAVSQDATADITAGLTDAGSTYTIASVIAALDSHLRLRGSINNRKEAQGMVGFRASTKAAIKQQAINTGSELIQLFCQDVLVVDQTGTLAWKQPHVQAAMGAGIRLGSEIGLPLTFKFLNANGIGHVVNPLTGVSAGDFIPETDFDEMIEAGVTFAERANGGFRIVVDNTTYGRDQSFIFNRGSVIEAAHFIARTIRQEAENTFIGNKIAERVSGGQPSQGIAQSIKNRIRERLLELNRDTITAPSIDAPLGFIEESLIVRVQGNTAFVEVHVKPVQGLDFVLITFTLGESTQVA